jgi:hypothetical protein
MEGWNFLTEYQQLCEAETEAFGRLLGTPVQRLATIAHGDEICTQHVTDLSLVHTRTTTAQPPRLLSPEASSYDGNRASRA